MALEGEPIFDTLELWMRDKLSPALAEAHAITNTLGRSEGQIAFLGAFQKALVFCANRAMQPHIPDWRR